MTGATSSSSSPPPRPTSPACSRRAIWSTTPTARRSPPPGPDASPLWTPSGTCAIRLRSRRPLLCRARATLPRRSGRRAFRRAERRAFRQVVADVVGEHDVSGVGAVHVAREVTEFVHEDRAQLRPVPGLVGVEHHVAQRVVLRVAVVLELVGP